MILRMKQEPLPSKEMINLILFAWRIKPSRERFIIWLKNNKWYSFGLSNKHAFGHDSYNFVVKFDPDIPPKVKKKDMWMYEDMTAFEYRQWTHARPRKKKYLTKPVLFEKGLLIQQRLDWTCHIRPRCQHCEEAERVARRLRIFDWYNHGSLNGKLKFFDTDSMGSGWYNWKKSSSRSMSS